MPLVIANAVLVRLIWTMAGNEHAVNVLGATGLGPAAVNQALANTVGANVKGLWTSSNCNTLVGTTFALSKVGVRSVGAANQPEFLDSGAAVPGTATGNYLPPQTAFVITSTTALAGKSYRGRTYFCGFTTFTLDASGSAVAGVGTALVAFMNGLLTGHFGAALDLAILSRVNNTAQPVTLVRSRNDQWETQRRRAIAGI